MTPHLNEEALVELLEQTEPDPHIAECAECRETLEEYRAITSCLGQEAAWDLRALKDEPVPQTIANLRAFADRMRAEDEAAVPLIAELLAGPREQWMPRLLADAKYRTAGVVRKLMEASDKAVDVMPPDALEITALSTEIADKLDPSAYPSDTVMKLRGNAWRDRGFCLLYTGQFCDVKTTMRRSLDAFRECLIPDYDLARLGVVEALHHRALDEFEDGVSAARESAVVFSRYGDNERLVASSLAEVHSLLKTGRAREALSLLRPLIVFADSLTTDTYARLFSNLGFCYREIGDLDSAIRHFELASIAFAYADSAQTEPLRLAWNIAILLLNNGQRAEGERRLLELVSRFERHGLASEAVLVRLDLADVYLEAGRFCEVEKTCREAIANFERAGVAYTVRARTALGYLHEAAKKRRITPEAVEHVRSYILGLPSEPTLVFAPPPL
jgi:tetratricopeptide (TPR) repeat protein